MVTFLSPAKINLFLHVVGRRPDGYHELASLFQTISLADRLQFSLQEKDELTCTDPIIPTDSSNLVLKAVNLFRKKTNLEFGVKVHLEKNIPIQSGLGGGSSNAATTLWALNKLLKTKISDLELMDWAGEIGSDISFFFSNGIALCTGRGEKVHNLKPLQKQKVSIFKPQQGLSTPLVYQTLNLKLVLSQNSNQIIEDFYKGNPYYFNDLEQPAMQLLPELKNLKRQLTQAGFSTVLMTGSGSAIFCLGEGKAKIDNVYQNEGSFIYRKANGWYEEQK